MSAPQLLGGRYEVGELLGRGGMAEVHLGHDARLSRPVAIKLLRSDLARDTSFLNRFRREAQSAAGLNHASIVAVYDSGEDRLTESGGATVPVPYIVMEYVEGQTLRELLNDRTRLEPDEAARITEGVLDALAYSHRMGIIHRDIKPANVMIGAGGDIKVMDFGIARAVADANATMTQTQSVIGTAQYLSPEQAQGHHVDARSDLYSAGCLLFELLTGRPPFQADSPVAIAYQHVGQPPPRPSSMNPAVSPALDAVILHALAKDREARYQDATAFRVDLQAARLDRPISDAARGTAATAPEATVALGAIGAAAAATTVLPSGATRPTAGPRGAGHGNTATLPAIGHDPDDEPGRRRSLAYVLLVLAVVGAAVLLGLAGKSLLDRPPQTPAQVSIPSVVDKPVETAEAEIRAVGLVPESTQVASTKEVGHVVEQSPGGGEMAARNSRVQLSVSAGPDTVDVPELKDFSQDEATAALDNLNLRVGSVKAVDDSGLDKGQVVDTSPGAGESVAVGSEVNLTVSSGKITTPDVVGKSRSEAAQILGDLGFRIKTEYVESSETEDSVTKQSLKKGQKVDDGTQIVITVAQPPRPDPDDDDHHHHRATDHHDDHAAGDDHHDRAAHADRDRDSHTPGTGPDPLTRRLPSVGGDRPGDTLGVAHQGAEADRTLHGVGEPADLQPVGQDAVPTLGQHALGVELHAVQGQVAVADGHDDAGLGAPVGEQRVRQRRRVDRQRVVAGRRERAAQPLEHAGVVVPDPGRLAVQQLRRPADGRATDDTEGLVAQAHPQHGLGALGARLDHGHRHPGLLGGAGPR